MSDTSAPDFRPFAHRLQLPGQYPYAVHDIETDYLLLNDGLIPVEEGKNRKFFFSGTKEIIVTSLLSQGIFVFQQQDLHFLGC
jgi:hypothetical protein